MSSVNEHRLLTRQTPSSMPTEDVKERMQKLREILDEVRNRLNDIVTEAVERIERIVPAGPIGKAAGNTLHADKKPTQEHGKLPEKCFQTRNSLLTDLFNESKHMKAVYNVWAAILFLLFLHTISHDLIETGTVQLGFLTIFIGFDQFTQVIKIWLLMTLSSFAVYVFHSFWAHQRVKFQPNSVVLEIWDYIWLSMLIAYQSAFLYIPAQAVLSAKFPPPSALVITMEQVRMMMKIHAFVRSTSPRVISYKPHAEGKEMKFPGFSKFLYFMFAPTLVYRDNYPRTRTIRWSFVVSCFVEVIFVMFFVAFLYERFISPTYGDYGRDPITVRNFTPKLFNSMLPGMGMYMCGFYCLLHAWFNAWAELLKFGDRMFYRDWWTATSFDAFYRNWNIVVHDWLYTYLYKDCYEIIVPGNKHVATFIVFGISALFHEFILSISFRLFYPMLFLFFGGIGYPLVYITRKTPRNFGNLFLWLLLSFGNGALLTFYSSEYFARVNCSGYGDQIMDAFVPRSILCNITSPANVSSI
ncbi:sterol O-acyltransferase 1 isoform X2 [Diachasma alloeum]|uniref:sterol O-acyltransferase 1 isoform X2 n=1 Tax=Diachasma alloeum TaxID=454923 RepID=UPI000738174F|nr:sterol O-acyltransferase 1 isoform X2 [Diachasma alloeum]